MRIVAMQMRPLSQVIGIFSLTRDLELPQGCGRFADNTRLIST